MSNLADGYAAMAAAAAAALEPDPNMSVDQWADEFAFIPADSGANEHGKYRTSRTPHARMVMQCLSNNHPCKRVVAKVASQMLKTQVALNWFGSTVHQSPSNFLWIVPTGTLVKRASGRIDKTIKAISVLEERVAGKRSRDASNNLTTKEYTGGTLHVLTAGAAANLSEVSARYLVFDEIDRAESSVEGEGSPVALAEARQTTFEQNRKAYYPSSPTIEGESQIDDLYRQGTQRHALADCVHCGHAQPLDFFKLIRSADGTQALYPCQECGGLHTEADKERMFRRGAWSDGVPGDGQTESFTMSQMFLPYGWFPWIGLLNKYETAKQMMEAGNEHDMIVFYNTRLALCYARAKEQAQWDVIMARAEPYALGTMPAGALVLTAAVDTQADRLEFKVMGWGEGMEGWLVDYQVITGSPAELDTWARLDQLLQGRYRHAAGQMVAISCVFIDSGGNATQEVYQFTYTRRRRHVYAIKGASKPNRPILSTKPGLVDVTYNGKTDKKGAQLWHIGTDTAKDYLAARWGRAKGPGAIHFPADLPEAYYKQLTAEYVTHQYRRGHKVRVWEKKHNDRNEALDLMVYNLAGAHYAGLHKKNEHQWSVLRERLVPKVPDLFTVIDSLPESDEEKPLPLDSGEATMSVVAVHENISVSTSTASVHSTPLQGSASQPNARRPRRGRLGGRIGQWTPI